MFHIMSLKTSLALKPFRAQITWKCSAFMFSHVRFKVTLSSESTLTSWTPETESSGVDLLMLRETGDSSE